VGTPPDGAVVLVRFPFSDLSFARPGKIFTANETIITTTVGTLTPEALARVLDAVVHVLRPPSPLD
jgi:hypothetical protein